MAFQDHYAVLGVKADASPEDIKRAYRRLAMETHPDRHPDDPAAEERFRKISTAYSVLSDPVQRARFNRARLMPESLDLNQPITVQTARDFFSSVVGDVFGRQRKQRRKGRDVRYTLSIELADAVLGSEHEIQFEANGLCSTCSGTGAKPQGRPAEACPLCKGRGQLKGEGLLGRWTACGRCHGMGMIQIDPCGDCRGSGARREKRAFRVKVPVGTESGAERVVHGQGEPGRFGGPPGNLRVTININKHPFLTREGQDIVCELPVSVTEAVRGAKVPVPTLTGAGVVKIPPGISHGTRMRLRGKGVPRERGAPGDQIVTVVIELPRVASNTALSEPERRAINDALTRLEEACATQPQVLPRRAAQRSSEATS